jgi:hypothetical protein
MAAAKGASVAKEGVFSDKSKPMMIRLSNITAAKGREPLLAIMAKIGWVTSDWTGSLSLVFVVVQPLQMLSEPAWGPRAWTK